MVLQWSRQRGYRTLQHERLELLAWRDDCNDYEVFDTHKRLTKAIGHWKEASSCNTAQVPSDHPGYGNRCKFNIKITKDRTTLCYMFTMAAAGRP